MGREVSLSFPNLDMSDARIIMDTFKYRAKVELFLEWTAQYMEAEYTRINLPNDLTRMAIFAKAKELGLI